MLRRFQLQLRKIKGKQHAAFAIQNAKHQLHRHKQQKHQRRQVLRKQLKQQNQQRQQKHKLPKRKSSLTIKRNYEY